MSQYYCQSCWRSSGLVNPTPTTNFTATKYQTDKFNKHTRLTASGGPISVYSETGYSNYASRIVSALSSGCLEIDDGGRKNLVILDERQNGMTWNNFQPVATTDATKVVLSEYPQYAHAFPTGSSDVRKAFCEFCGNRVQ